jgi:hypothetical protein
MIAGASRPILAVILSALAVACFGMAGARAQDAGMTGPQFNLRSAPMPPLDLPGILPETGNDLPGPSSFAAPRQEAPLAVEGGEVTLAAHLTEGSEEIPRGLVWRVFKPDPGDDGKLPLVASAEGGTSRLHLAPGSYLVHASFGRAGATKRITVGNGAQREDVVLDAGGLELDAVLSGGVKVPAKRLKFSIYEKEPGVAGEGVLIIPNVKPNTVVRLKAGIYHVVSTYGTVNAVIRADIRVEAGKLTQATMEHRAAHLTMKLVREAGGEAIADTAWSILTDGGDVVRETVGAYASMVLAQGDYTIIAKNRERIYQRDFHVEPGKNQEVELLPADQIDDTAQDADTEQD